jgi:hypothetical protein
MSGPKPGNHSTPVPSSAIPVKGGQPSQALPRIASGARPIRTVIAEIPGTDRQVRLDLDAEGRPVNEGSVALVETLIGRGWYPPSCARAGPALNDEGSTPIRREAPHGCSAQSQQQFTQTSAGQCAGSPEVPSSGPKGGRQEKGGRLLTTEQLASELGICEKAIRKAARSGQIPAHKFPPGSIRGQWRYDLSEVREALRNSEHKPRARHRKLKGLSAW